MSYAVMFDRRGERDFARLPPVMMARVATALRGLADTPRPPGAKALTGKLRGMLRLRVGDWRVVYQVDDDARTVVVIGIAHRGDVCERSRRRNE